MHWDDSTTYYKHNGKRIAQCDPPHGRGRGDYWERMVEDAMPHPALIRRVTKGMHRADWEPPCKGMTTESIAKAYLEEWGSTENNELIRFGIRTNLMGHYARKFGWIESETKGRKGERGIFYSLK